MFRPSDSDPGRPATWELTTAAYTLVLAVILPLEQMAYHADFTHPILFVLRWLGYVLFGIDVLLRHRRGEYRPGAAGRNWLTPDLLAALPIGPLASRLWPAAPGWLLVAAHVLPILRLLRVYVLARGWQQSNPAQTGLRRIASTIAVIALSIHWIGCWQIAVYPPDPAASITLRYVQAVYWTVTTMTTIGYGDITPDLNQTRSLIFTMIIMLLGAGAFGFIIGNIATIMSNLDFARNQHLDKIQRINAFMRHHKIPPGLQQRVNGYYAHLWQTRRGFDESVVLSDLPDTIRRDMEIHLRHDIVSKVPFFRGADARMIREVVAALKPRIALPDEVIIERGEIGESMYFIASGAVEVLGPDDQSPVATLNEGNFFGEIALLERSPRMASVRAVSNCDLYTLDKTALDQIVDRYPEFGRHIRAMAEQRRGK